MILDPDELSRLDRYRWMIGAIVPRPIAFVSTVSPEGVTNLAPFSFFNGICSTPPILSLAIGRKKGGEPKDTLRNLTQTGELVVNLVTEPMGQAMVATSGNWPAEVSEFAECGFSEAPSQKVRAPRVAQSPLSLECSLVQTLEVGAIPTTLVLAEVQLIHVADEVLVDGFPDPAKLAPLGRLGGQSYAGLGPVIQIDRPR